MDNSSTIGHNHTWVGVCALRRRGAHCGGTSCEARKQYLYLEWVAGARFEGTSNGTLGISDTIVGGNTFSYNGLSGLSDRAHRMLLENNTISYNNVESFAKGWDAAGIKTTRTDRLRSRNNLNITSPTQSGLMYRPQMQISSITPPL